MQIDELIRQEHTFLKGLYILHAAYMTLLWLIVIRRIEKKAKDSSVNKLKTGQENK